MAQPESAPQPILGLVVLCCLLSALVGAMFTSAVWTQKADERVENAVAQSCPTVPTTTVPQTTTTSGQTTTAVPSQPQAQTGGGGTPAPAPSPSIAPTTAPPRPTPTTAPEGSRDNPIGADPTATTTAPVAED